MIGSKLSDWSISRLQPLGRALMLPIAVLPVAGLLLRLGQPDLLGLPFVAASGDAIFANLGLLFAIGIAVGLARENHGAAGLAGAVAFLTDRAFDGGDGLDRGKARLQLLGRPVRLSAGVSRLGPRRSGTRPKITSRSALWN